MKKVEKFGIFSTLAINERFLVKVINRKDNFRRKKKKKEEILFELNHLSLGNRVTIL